MPPLKIKKFSGEAGDWEIWSTQFMAALGSKGLVKLLLFPIPKDGEDLKV